MAREKGVYRKFNGKTFEIGKVTTSKREVEDYKTRARAAGIDVRVIKETSGKFKGKYVIYARHR